MVQNYWKQAGAELCQAQHSLSKLPTSSELASNLQGGLSQPAVAGTGSLGELQSQILPPLITNWHGGEKLAKASYPLGLS